MKNALDICEPYFEHLELYGPGNLQVLGGVGSAALSQPDLVVDFEARELSLVTDLYLPQYRDGGSKRDLDVLVLSTDQAEVDEAKRQAFVNIGKELELSFFGLKHHSQLNDMAARPVRSSLKSFVGDRYVTTNPDGTIATQVKTLYPFMVPVDVATLETWTLLLHNPNADRLSPRVATLQVPIPPRL